MKRVLICSLCSMIPWATQAYDDGYLPFWKTALNLVSPPVADRPVEDRERLGPYPLLTNPTSFEDGFQPGKYGLWQGITLDEASTGAKCGNGTPYKFFVNRVADNNNYLIYLEGGGACWDYESCTGQTGIRGARNPNGIPDDYMRKLESSLVSPFVFRLHYADHPQPQDWNLVYVPYCTGDVYSGDKTAVYESPESNVEPLTWHHNGFKNMRAVTAWLRENMQQPTRMMMTGCSAGGTGSLVNYHLMRRDLSPTSRAYLLNDSGPIYHARMGSDQPSVPLHTKIKEAWGLDKVIDTVGADISGFDRDDLGTVNGALAMHWPEDRMAHVQFMKDLNYSSYSYERFYDEINHEPDKLKKWAKIHEKWDKDARNLASSLDEYANFAYYLPQFRDLNESHCATIVEFHGGDIQTQGMELSQFIDDLVDDRKPLNSYLEEDPEADYSKGANLFYLLLNKVLGAPSSTNPRNQEAG